MSVRTTDIYTALKDQAFTLGGVAAVRTAGPDDIPNSAEAMELPLRILSPKSGGRLVRFSSLAGNRVIDWTITDTLLARETGAGLGPSDITGALLTYQEDYEAFLPTLRAIQWNCTGWQSDGTQVIEWPEGSGRQYDGVRMTLTFRELR